MLRVGINLWQAMHWAEHDQARLLRELDRLVAIGFDHVRIMACSQGEPENPLPHRMHPASEIAPGLHRPEGDAALEFLFTALADRGLQAIVVLGNFWHWSGGFTQYLLWTGKKEYRRDIAAGYGADAKPKDMFPIYRMAARFFDDEDAQALYLASAKRIVQRYAHWYPRVVMSWQLANEPTPLSNVESFLRWCQRSVDALKELAPDQPFSLGGVGTGPIPKSLSYTPLERAYPQGRFTFITVHLWPQNWGWYSPRGASKLRLWWAKFLSRRYLRFHASKAKELAIPMHLEELGLARDGGSFERGSATVQRDAFFRFVIDELRTLAVDHPILGIAFWAWGGEGEPGHTWTGDPPHEPQGWYSIFAEDASTLALIRNAKR